MFKTLIDAFKVKEVRSKLLLTLLLLLIYRLGCFIPIPGIDVEILKSGVEGQPFLNLLSSISGGALSQGAFLALGVSPYITASIIIQLLAVVIPSWERLSKEGEEGRRKLSLYNKIAALVIAVAQAVGIVVGLNASGYVDASLFAGAPAFVNIAFIVIVLVSGAMFTVWLGEKISEIGIGNGMSLLIFVGILSSAGTAILRNFQGIASGDSSEIWQLIIFLILMIVIFALIVLVDGAERKVPIQYAKQIKGRKMYGGQSTYIPVKVNGSGVMPIIFASAIITFPQLLFSIFWPNTTGGFIGWWNTYLGAGSWVYSVVMAVLIVFFAYFYSMISFNPDDISRQIQQNGGFIPGIRPGKPTSQHLKSISKKITLFGALFLAFMALIPTLIFKAMPFEGLVGSFSATALLIVVSVALEFDKRLEEQLLIRNYRGFLK